VAQCWYDGAGGSVLRAWPGEDLDAHPVGIEDEDRVIAVDVTILFGWKVDARAVGNTALVCAVHLVPAVDLEREVLDPDVVVAMGPPSAGRSPNIAPVVGSWR
jgi:hypothetical protein